MPGLKDVLFSGRGELVYRLMGRKVQPDRLSLHLDVEGVLGVRCQRCLEEMDFSVDITRIFILVASESEIPEDDLDDDEVDYLVSSPKMDVQALVEEEVLLSLPVAMLHEHGCTDATVSSVVGKPNPFQVLEGLKKKL